MDQGFQQFLEIRPLIEGGMLLGGLAIGGWIITTWLRVRHGYPLPDSLGKLSHPTKKPEAERMVGALAEENRHLRTELGEMKNRVAVLERIATDPGARLDREIASLNANLN